MKEKIKLSIVNLCDNILCTNVQNAYPSSAFTLLLQLNHSFGDTSEVTDLLLLELGNTLQDFSNY